MSLVYGGARHSSRSYLTPSIQVSSSAAVKSKPKRSAEARASEGKGPVTAPINKTAEFFDTVNDMKCSAVAEESKVELEPAADTAKIEPLSTKDVIQRTDRILGQVNVGDMDSISMIFAHVSPKVADEIIDSWGQLSAHNEHKVGKFRYFYDGDEQSLEIYTCGWPGHEQGSRIEEDWITQLREQNFYTDRMVQDYEGNSAIIAGRSTDLILEGHNGNQIKQQPDGQLQWAGLGSMAWLVIEVENTQEYGRAAKKVNNYLLGSRGMIRFVVLIDLDLDPKRKKSADQRIEDADPDAEAETKEMEEHEGKDNPKVRIYPDRWAHIKTGDLLYRSAYVSVWTSEVEDIDSEPTRVPVPILDQVKVWPLNDSDAVPSFTLSYAQLNLADSVKDEIGDKWDQQFSLDFKPLHRLMNTLRKNAPIFDGSKSEIKDGIFHAQRDPPGMKRKWIEPTKKTKRLKETSTSTLTSTSP